MTPTNAGVAMGETNPKPQLASRFKKVVTGGFLILASLLILLGMSPVVALATTNAPSTNVPAPTEADILTPKPPATPRLTGPKVFGVRPGNPFLFKVTATGDKPMTFSADNLPAGLTLDAATGMITGTLQEKGSNSVTLHAKNALGSASRSFRIVCGDTISLTPALGWNSWNYFGTRVTETDVRGAADAMVASGLIDHGWTYINIDDRWQGGRDTNGMIQSNEKFPDMKALADYIHAKGLKFGIYSSPGPKTCAGAIGSYQHEDQDARQYGNWEVDYVKYDWCSYALLANKIRAERYIAVLPAAEGAKIKALAEEKNVITSVRRTKRTDAQNARFVELNREWNALIANLSSAEKDRIEFEVEQGAYALFRKSLDKVKRDILYSICQYGRKNVWEWGEKVGGNSWRTGGDIKPNWERVSSLGFSLAGLEKYAGPGHWNDPDMLEIGNGNLTADEQLTHMSLWALVSSPLLIGCDMTKMTPFTVSLLSNDEVLDVNQDPLGKPAGRLSKNGNTQVWARSLEDGAKAVGLFNLGDQPAKVTVTWAELGIKGPQIVRDLWRHKDLGSFPEKFEATVPCHGVVLVKIRR